MDFRQALNRFKKSGRKSDLSIENMVLLTSIQFWKLCEYAQNCASFYV